MVNLDHLLAGHNPLVGSARLVPISMFALAAPTYGRSRRENIDRERPRCVVALIARCNACTSSGVSERASACWAMGGWATIRRP